MPRFLNIREEADYSNPEDRFVVSNHFNPIYIGSLYQVTCPIPHKRHNGRICKVLCFRYFQQELRAKVLWQDTNQVGHVDPLDLKLLSEEKPE